ncbi:MAG: ABC transporter permease [Chloroflexi bacterium]|nr:ABC transporter permease [Chloroflexota bacterium]
MQLMRSLADQGRSIILITHATKNVMLADKVIFLARGGQSAWYGPPNEALAWFDQYRSERERRAEDMSFDKIYNILEDSSKGTPADWEARFKASPAYEKYIAAPLGLTPHTPAAEAVSPALKPAAPRLDRAAARRVSGLRQFFILSARNLNILIRDRFSLILMLLTAPLLAAFDFIIARRDIFDSTTGRAERVAVTLFTLTITAIFVGALAQMREIVKEADIYKRERLVNLKIAPYVLSKIWLAMLLALYQSAAYLIVRYIAVKMPGGPSEMVAIYVTLVLASLAGMMLGLFVSALSPSANAAPLLTILVLIPQIILGGGILPISSLNPVGRAASSLMASRWAFEALGTISGFGRDVAADTCWRLPKDERTALSSDYKDANCTCLGKKLFKQCYFPGLLAFYDSAVERSEPAKPVEPLSPGDPPPQPTFPPEPTLPPTPQPPPTPERPEPLTFGLSKPPAPPEQPEVYTPIAQLQYNIAVGQYLQDLDAFNRKAQAGQLAYMGSYTRSIEDYLDALQAYNGEVQSLQQEYNDRVQRIREDYNRQVEAIRQQYADELNAYQVKVETARAEQERYRSAIEAYQQDYGEWQRARARSVAGAETMLANFYDRYGDVYAVNVPSRWLAQGGIIVGLFALILILQKRKDVV